MHHEIMRTKSYWRKPMKLKLIAAVTLGAGLLSAAEAPERLEAAADSLKEVMGIPDKSIPQDLLDRAQCIVIVPDLKKGAFIVGAKYGKGFVVAAAKEGVGWSAPGLHSGRRRELRIPDRRHGNRRLHAGDESKRHGPAAFDEIHARRRRLRRGRSRWAAPRKPKPTPP